MDGCARSLLQSFNFVDRQGADLVFSLRFGRIATFSNSINRTQGKSTLRFLAPSIISTEARGVAAGAGFAAGASVTGRSRRDALVSVFGCSLFIEPGSGTG